MGHYLWTFTKQTAIACFAAVDRYPFYAQIQGSATSWSLATQLIRFPHAAAASSIRFTDRSNQVLEADLFRRSQNLSSAFRINVSVEHKTQETASRNIFS